MNIPDWLFKETLENKPKKIFNPINWSKWFEKILK